MHLLLFLLVITCCSPSDGVTSTKINYLPNGQVGGYELIINNTVEPRIDSSLPRDRMSKILRHASNVGSGFTRVDEQVIGKNSYLKVHRILEQQKQEQQKHEQQKHEQQKHEQQKHEPQQQVRMKYPVKTVLMTPGVYDVNGVPEKVTLRFVQIGPYAALIVPTNKSESSANPKFWVPPEIKDSIKEYIELQEPPSLMSQTSQKAKTGYAYAPTTDQYPSNISPYDMQKSISQVSTPSMNLQQPGETEHYIYPEATRLSNPMSGPSEKGNAYEDGFVIRVVNPSKVDPNSQDFGNQYQEFFAPARLDQLDPQKDDTIIANPLKYSGSSGPSTSQFGEVYSKDKPSFRSLSTSDPLSEYGGRANDEPPTDQSREPAADFKGPANNVQTDLRSYSAPHEDGKQVDGEKYASDKGRAQSAWSLVETQDPEVGYNQFEVPPPGQPEFSDVSPDSDLKNILPQQYGLETYNSGQFQELGRGSGSESPGLRTLNQPTISQTDAVSEKGKTFAPSVSASVGSQLEKFGPSVTEGAKQIPKLTSGEAGQTMQQYLFDRFQDSKFRDPAQIEQTFWNTGSTQQFRGNPGKNEERVTNEGFQYQKTYDETFSPSLNDKPGEAYPTETSGIFQEQTLGRMSNFNPSLASSGSGLQSKQLQDTSNEGRIVNDYSSDAGGNGQQFGRFQGTTRLSFEQFPIHNSASADQFLGTTVKNDVPSSATAPSAQQFGRILDTTAQSNRNVATTASSSAHQFNQYQDTYRNKLGKFDGSTYDASSDLKQQFKQFQGTPNQNPERVSSDNLATAAALSESEFNQLGKLAAVGVDPAVQPKQLLPQKEDKVFNPSNRNIEFTAIDGSGNLPFIDDEKFKKFIQHPSLTTQFNILSPNGQTLAVLTSTGNSAKIELPSSDSLKSQADGNIVIPDTAFPLPGSGASLNSEQNQRETAIPLVRNPYNSFVGLQNVQNGVTDSSLKLVNQQPSSVFVSPNEDFRPVPNFDFTSAAAAAAAAVAADTEHFNRFDTIEKHETNQQPLSDTLDIRVNQQRYPSESITEARRPISEQPSSERGEAKLAGNAVPSEYAQILANINTGRPPSEFKDLKGRENVLNEYAKKEYTGSDASLGSHISSQSELSEEGGRIRDENLPSKFLTSTSSSGDTGYTKQLSTLNSVNLKYPQVDTFAKSSGRPISDQFTYAVAAGNAAGNGNQQRLAVSNYGGSSFRYTDVTESKNILDQRNKESGAQLNNLPTSIQPSEDEQKFEKEYFTSQFLKDNTSGNLNFKTQEPVGNSRVNFATAPGVRQNSPLLSTYNGHAVKSPEAAEISRPRGVVIPKYGIPDTNKARIPLNLQAGGSVTPHDSYASAYGTYVTPVIRKYNQYAGVKVVVSPPSPILGPHTGGLLGTANALVGVPKRQVIPIPVAT